MEFAVDGATSRMRQRIKPIVLGMFTNFLSFDHELRPFCIIYTLIREPPSCGLDYSSCLMADKRELKNTPWMREELEDFTQRLGLTKFV